MSEKTHSPEDGALRIGSLFSGYGGLEMAVSNVLGGELAWCSEIDKGALKILNHRHPDLPNLGDITTVDWSQVEPVDVLTGGSPCQDLSHAGKRAGMTEGTRSNLWVAMREAIAQLRPSLVVWENVRGAYSAAADSAVEPCAGCVGDGPGVHLRALGRVLGDLSDLGYDAIWHGLRAADIGAPHGRFRVFVAAYPKGDEGWLRNRDGRATQHASIAGPHGRSSGRIQHSEPSEGRRQPLTLLPSPRATDGTKGGPNQRGSSGDLMLPSAVTLLPTPAVNDMGEGKTVDAWDEWTADMQAKHANGNGHGKSLSIEAQRLLPTPRAKNNENRQTEGYGGEDGDFHGLLHNPERWGDYAPAIARWENALGRSAPEPTQLSSKGNPQLAPAFVEWMMGLPAGWVSDVPGVTRNEALKALGNGVVPQQAESALRHILTSAQAVAA